MEIKDAKLWWPYELGEPFLYNLNISIYDKNTQLDSVSYNFV